MAVADSPSSRPPGCHVLSPLPSASLCRDAKCTPHVGLGMVRLIVVSDSVGSDEIRRAAANLPPKARQYMNAPRGECDLWFQRSCAGGSRRLRPVPLGPSASRRLAYRRSELSCSRSRTFTVSLTTER